MSEATSVLLPAARVDVYGLDEKTVNSANSLVRDWRFSRVSMRVVDAGIDGAISDYEQHVSPDLIIIETNDISDKFIEKLGELAENCIEGTEAIIIGPENDVQLYRKLVGLGVKDYLVGPGEEKQLSEVIAQTLLDKKGISDSQIIAVMGCKGGVGATTAAHMLATVLSDQLGHKTLFMDAAGGWGTAAIPFAAETTTTLSEAVRQVQGGSEDDIKRLLHDDTEKLTLLPTGGDPLLETSCDDDSFEALLDHFMHTYPFIVVDLSAAEHHLQRRTLKKAQNAIVVSSPLLPSLRNCRTLLKELVDEDQDENENKPSLIINMEGVSKAHEVPKKDIETLLEYEVSLTLPYDLKLFVGSESSEQEVTRNKAAAKTLQPFVEFVRSIAPEAQASETEKKAQGQGFLSKILKK